jgi:hypothetical protein
MSKIKQAYLRLLEALDKDGDLTATPIYDKLEREWAERGFAPIGK